MLQYPQQLATLRIVSYFIALDRQVMHLAKPTEWQKFRKELLDIRRSGA